MNMLRKTGLFSTTAKMFGAMMAAGSAMFAAAEERATQLASFSPVNASTVYQVYSELGKYTQGLFDAIKNGEYGINPNVTINSLAPFDTLLNEHPGGNVVEFLRQAGDAANATFEEFVTNQIKQAIAEYNYDSAVALGLAIGIPLTLGIAATVLYILIWTDRIPLDCCDKPATNNNNPVDDAVIAVDNIQERDQSDSSEEVTPSSEQEVDSQPQQRNAMV
jgi:hypothetical protein